MDDLITSHALKPTTEIPFSLLRMNECIVKTDEDTGWQCVFKELGIAISEQEAIVFDGQGGWCVIGKESGIGMRVLVDNALDLESLALAVGDEKLKNVIMKASGLSESAWKNAENNIRKRRLITRLPFIRIPSEEINKLFNEDTVKNYELLKTMTVKLADILEWSKQLRLNQEKSSMHDYLVNETKAEMGK